MKKIYKVLIALVTAAFVSGFCGCGFSMLIKFPEYDIFLQALSGVIGVALGYYITIALKKPETKNEHIFTVFSSLCISGTIIVMRKFVQFFIDFYTGSNLLKCEFVEDDHWFFRVFGFGMSPYEQRPLLDTDEDFTISILFSLISTGVLYLYVRIKNKALFTVNKVREQKMAPAVFFKKRIRQEIHKVSEDCNIWDTLLWWCTRGVMLYAYIVMENRAEATLLLANLVGTFAITLVHLVFPEKSVFNKISYKTQSLITVMVFLGSWCGNYVQVYYIVPRFDLFLHLVSGFLCVMGGYYIARALIETKNKKQIFLVSFFAFCFSMFIMPFWEVSEFIGDFIWGTDNQGFYWGPTDESFFFKVFGHGAGNTQLYYLFDTFYDMLLAFVTTVITFAGLYVGLLVKLKRNGNKENNIQEEKISVYS